MSVRSSLVHISTTHARSPRRKHAPALWATWKFFLVLLLLGNFDVAVARDPKALLSQYGHTAWRVRDGALPGAPRAIAQTQDGYLWIGTNAGLYRFDGVRFVPLSPANGARLTSPEIVSLLGTRDGSLWIGTTGGLARWSHNRLTELSGTRGSVVRILEDEEGGVWFARTRPHHTDQRGPLCRVSAAFDVVCFGQESGIPYRIATALARGVDGDLWIGSSNELLRWNPTSHGTFAFASPTLNPVLSGIEALEPETDGSLWVGFSKRGRGLGLQRLVNTRFETLEVPGLTGDSLRVSALMRDTSGALWIGTDNAGVYHVQDGRVDRYSSADGLSSDGVDDFFEDREGNVWVATIGGLDRFRPMRVLTLATREGLPSAIADAVLATSDGTVWLSNYDSMVALRDGGIHAILGGDALPGNQPTSLFEDRDGRLWAGVDLNMAVLERGRFRVIANPDGSPIGTALGITQDASGDIWILAVANPTKLVRVRNFRVVQVIEPPAIPPTRRILADPREGLWLGTMDGDLAHLTAQGLHTVQFHLDPQTNQIQQIAIAEDGAVLAATSSGVIGWRAGKSALLNSANGLPCERISSLVFDADGALWLYATCGLIRIEARELAKWWEHSETELAHTLLDATDGVQPAATPFTPSAVRATDGRLWFVNGAGAQSVIPDALSANSVVPPVHIEALVADGSSYSLDESVRLPARTRDIEIQYTALSFVLPEKVLFRYRLEGHDDAWRDADTRRRVLFADLPPGDYRFQVIARNNDGVWNDVGASVAFAIAPMFYQTRSFMAVCVLGTASLIFAFFKLRLRQIKRRLRAQMEERVAERERIARELHDTFLQSVQALMLRFQSVLRMIPDASPARLRMEQALDRADAVIDEGRERIQALRSPGELREDLAESLNELIEELATGVDCNVCVVREGEMRGLHPVVADEIERIAREALTNALRHARATRIEVMIGYSRRTFVLRVADDGSGFEWRDDVPGRPGHWGLQGMYERARRIRARLGIVTRPGAGTTIELIVPATLAYGTARFKRGSLFTENG
jgi:signal transduction histidine kinase/ligand-binding sensor domain-containing protein